ncbi:hypothetical protein HMPREF2711_04030 [Neisseria sp. HMSC070A01]|jgi:hypothetical protein|uniref:hypothetical protein n=1 Tax=Neisseria sp. HMSC070A01 TaxID=1715190 RepID=UPI0008A0FB53|nr:hypothetical protein [Neisseria sp. HMSC070A01]OFM23060.1 hypothetical protein HMPREF2711_04030 [Neisseria sp. HMSC070A01]
MGKAEVDAIIADVFRVSGIKLTADDPVIAILLVQESRLKALFEEQRNHTREDFDGIAAEIEEPLKTAVQIAEDLKTYREQIMADLLAGYGKELAESEGKLYATIQAKIDKQMKGYLDEVTTKLNRSWLVAALIFFCSILVLKFV